LHISEDQGKLLKYDCFDFKILLDAFGVNWEKRDDLPSIIDGDVKFDLTLRPGIDDALEDGDESDEIKDPKKEEVQDEIEDESEGEEEEEEVEDDEDEEGKE
jgi:hypothetical protein